MNDKEREQRVREDINVTQRVKKLSDAVIEFGDLFYNTALTIRREYYLDGKRDGEILNCAEKTIYILKAIKYCGPLLDKLYDMTTEHNTKKNREQAK